MQYNAEDFIAVGTCLSLYRNYRTLVTEHSIQKWCKHICIKYLSRHLAWCRLLENMSVSVVYVCQTEMDERNNEAGCVILELGTVFKQ